MQLNVWFDDFHKNFEIWQLENPKKNAYFLPFWICFARTKKEEKAIVAYVHFRHYLHRPT